MSPKYSISIKKCHTKLCPPVLFRSPMTFLTGCLQPVYVIVFELPDAPPQVNRPTLSYGSVPGLWRLAKGFFLFGIYWINLFETRTWVAHLIPPYSPLFGHLWWASDSSVPVLGQSRNWKWGLTSYLNSSRWLLGRQNSEIEPENFMKFSLILRGIQ